MNELLVSDIFVILNFVDIKKEEGINFVIIKSVQKKNANVSKFGTMGISK